ncbi:hypothetical protein [uncultured Ruminococcus sp.]|uniref:hypothetical protein n=1 Tax=uncultured Ruminococcus sp. TaxID=165186 RepID=UPI0025F4D845|nr:hypothetical protein [uncultured Ruminococcus sp.]
MAVLKLDPPPSTNDVSVLRGYINDLYDALVNVVYNLDGDNMSEEFLSSIHTTNKSESGEM